MKYSSSISLLLSLVTCEVVFCPPGDTIVLSLPVAGVTTTVGGAGGGGGGALVLPSVLVALLGVAGDFSSELSALDPVL